MKRDFCLTTVPFAATVVSFGLAVEAAFYLLHNPASYVGMGPNHTRKYASLVEINGQGVVDTVMFPVVVALAPLLVPLRKVRIVATVLIWGFTLLGSMSIGLSYVPPALAMLMATCCGVLAKSESIPG